MEAVKSMDKIDTLKGVCKSYGIALIYLFGSRAEEADRYLHGDKLIINDPLADIDIGVVFLQNLPPAVERCSLYADIFNELAGLFKPYPVDLSFLEENHAVFQVEALKGRCVFHIDNHFKDRYEEMILCRAADFKPILELFLKEALEGV